MTEQEKEIHNTSENIEKEGHSNNEPISIATRNLRLLKRIILGKNKPPLFLRILCWGNLGWSTLMALYYGIIGVLILTSVMNDQEISQMGSRYFFVYACLHILAIIGTILMWRLKKMGFYIYSVSTIIMPFLYVLINWNSLKGFTDNIEPIVLLFSLITIGLFAINWKSLNLIKKKESES